MGYDLFISYSHRGDSLLAERVQKALVRYAKPWWRRQSLSVFRDRTGLTANPGLWSSISEAIDESKFFLLLASPESAASVWCTREVEQWLANSGADRLLILLTAGEILWDGDAGDFDWQATTALPRGLAGSFSELPRYVDMRWARVELQLDLTDGRFRDQIAELAAPVRGMAKDALVGADVRHRRRLFRQVSAAFLVLVLLTVALGVTVRYALASEDRLLRQRVREVAAVVTAAVPSIQTPLESAAVLAEATNGDAGDFRGLVAPIVKAGQPFTSLSLWSTRHPGGPLVVVGALPELGAESQTEVEQLFRRTTGSPTVAINNLLARPDRRLGYAMTVPSRDARFLVYGEASSPRERRARIDKDSAFADLGYALYVGDSVDSRYLLASSTGGALMHGRRASVAVPFGDTHLLVVMTFLKALPAHDFVDRVWWLFGALALVLILVVIAPFRRSPRLWSARRAPTSAEGRGP